jgi:hypothetical protein
MLTLDKVKMTVIQTAENGVVNKARGGRYECLPGDIGACPENI